MLSMQPDLFFENRAILGTAANRIKTLMLKFDKLSNLSWPKKKNRRLF